MSKKVKLVQLADNYMPFKWMSISSNLHPITAIHPQLLRTAATSAVRGWSISGFTQ